MNDGQSNDSTTLSIMASLVSGNTRLVGIKLIVLLTATLTIKSPTSPSCSPEFAVFITLTRLLVGFLTARL